MTCSLAFDCLAPFRYKPLTNVTIGRVSLCDPDCAPLSTSGYGNYSLNFTIEFPSSFTITPQFEIHIVNYHDLYSLQDSRNARIILTILDVHLTHVLISVRRWYYNQLKTLDIQWTASLNIYLKMTNIKVFNNQQFSLPNELSAPFKAYPLISGLDISGVEVLLSCQTNNCKIQATFYQLYITIVFIPDLDGTIYQNVFLYSQIPPSGLYSLNYSLPPTQSLITPDLNYLYGIQAGQFIPFIGISHVWNGSEHYLALKFDTTEGLINHTFSLITFAEIICYKNAQKTQGQCECINGFIANYKIQTCEACHPTCKECTGTQLEQCIGCQTGLEPDNGQCICPEYHEFDSNWSCVVICHSTCETCSGHKDYECVTCKANRHLTQGLSLQNSTYCPCDASFYEDQQINCQMCHPTCLECVGPDPVNCKSCSTQDNRQAIVILGKCLCNPGYFENSELNCESCGHPCKECMNKSSLCTSCLDGFIVADNSCICETGNYQAQYVCHPCHQKCFSCSDKAINCFSCKSGYNFIAIHNICACPSNKVEDITTFQCDDCDSTCKTCTNSSASGCLICARNRKFNQSICSCAVGYFEDQNRNCSKCSEECIICSGFNTCQICQKDLLLDQATNLCIPKQLKSTSTQSTMITPVICHASCATCQDNGQQDCITCDSNKLQILNKGKCKCIQGYYMEVQLGNCKVCHQFCHDCKGGLSSDCLSCDSKKFRVLVNNSCECLDDYTLGQDGTACRLIRNLNNRPIERCLDQCIECSNQISTNSNVGTIVPVADGCACNALCSITQSQDKQIIIQMNSTFVALKDTSTFTGNFFLLGSHLTYFDMFIKSPQFLLLFTFADLQQPTLVYGFYRILSASVFIPNWSGNQDDANKTRLSDYFYEHFNEEAYRDPIPNKRLRLMGFSGNSFYTTYIQQVILLFLFICYVISAQLGKSESTSKAFKLSGYIIYFILNIVEENCFFFVSQQIITLLYFNTFKGSVLIYSWSFPFAIGFLFVYQAHLIMTLYSIPKIVESSLSPSDKLLRLQKYKNYLEFIDKSSKLKCLYKVINQQKKIVLIISAITLGNYQVIFIVEVIVAQTVSIVHILSCKPYQQTYFNILDILRQLGFLAYTISYSYIQIVSSKGSPFGQSGRHLIIISLVAMAVDFLIWAIRFIHFFKRIVIYIKSQCFKNNIHQQENPMYIIELQFQETPIRAQ